MMRYLWSCIKTNICCMKTKKDNTYKLNDTFLDDIQTRYIVCDV